MLMTAPSQISLSVPVAQKLTDIGKTIVRQKIRTASNRKENVLAPRTMPANARKWCCVVWARRQPNIPSVFASCIKTQMAI
jgi:hypothetical protein